MLLKSIFRSLIMAVKGRTVNLDDQRFLRELGECLRQHRVNRKWTQAELARRCELHRTFIGSVERGERNLSILNLRLIARVLRVSLVDLFSSI
jgi:DNA-binding XRE family transcriptional regulator